MGARYLVRFDDVCPTMDWRIWDRIEPVIWRHRVRPIMAVVPDNRDPHLAIDSPKSDFWSRVRQWQAAGWIIALHGYQHLYSSSERGLLGLNAFSEFAGLDEDLQRDKLERALNIFRNEGVRADAWVAPGHSFDATTVRLLVGFGITVISDGFYYRPVKYLGASWIPQQLWRFRSMPGGLWTVCHHTNRFDAAAVESFAAHLNTYGSRIDTLPLQKQLASIPQRTAFDRMFASTWLAALRLKRLRAPA